MVTPLYSDIHDRIPVILNPQDELVFLIDREIIQIGIPIGCMMYVLRRIPFVRIVRI